MFSSATRRFFSSSSSAAVRHGDELAEHIARGGVSRHALWRKHKIGTVALPNELERRLRTLLKDVPRDRLRDEATRLSSALRARTRRGTLLESADAQLSSQVIVYDQPKALAYAAVRLPGVYSCVARVLAELRVRRPALQVRRVLDYGCGPATAMLAADKVFGGGEGDSALRYTAIEPSAAMEQVARAMLGSEMRERVTFNRYDALASDAHVYDVCMLSYVLSELGTAKARRRLARSLWERVRVGGALVAIEPGTPIGFEMVRELREVILGIGKHKEDSAASSDDAPSDTANCVAPCPHNLECPLDVKSTWCHFSQRMRRPVLTTSAKRGAANNFEDEKFSYVILEKLDADAPLEQAKIRLIRPPKKRSGHAIMYACHSDGTAPRIVASRGMSKQLYAASRKAGWGDELINLDNEKFRREATRSSPTKK